MPLAAPGSAGARKEHVVHRGGHRRAGRLRRLPGPGPAIPTAEQLDSADADLASGGELFRTNCAQCHNFAGQGGALTQGKYAPTLMGSSAEDIYEAMLTGPQNMPVFSDAQLPTEQKQAIITYIKDLQEAPTPAA